MFKSSSDLISWDESFSTGIKLIDEQHKELVVLTNELFNACRQGDNNIGPVFKDALSSMVDYVRFHFTAELEILQRINYPGYLDHKKQHDDLIIKILSASKEYATGKKFTPNKFARTLRDWVFGHIAFYDKHYAAFIIEQKSKGLLTDI